MVKNKNSKGDDMENLNIGIKRKISRRNDPNAAEADIEFDQIKRTVFIKAKNMCACCKAPTTTTASAPQGFFEVHHRDDDHTNNDDSNLILICPFCHMVFSCGKHGKDFETPRSDSAHLLWLPNVPQNTLNLLAHLIFQVRFTAENRTKFMARDHPAKWLPQNIVEIASKMEQAILSVGSENVATIFGKKKTGGSIECHHFYDMLKGLNNADYENRIRLFSGMRLWPKYDKFSDLTQFLSTSGKLLKSIPMDIFTTKES